MANEPELMGRTQTVRSIKDLRDDMLRLRDALVDGTARTEDGTAASGDIEAAIQALDNAIGVLTDAAAATTARDATTSMAIDADQVPEPQPHVFAVAKTHPGAPDNLKSIRGISSATAQALNDQGLTRFAHIAHLDTADVAALKRTLGYRFTLHRDGWIEQAALLAAGRSTSFSRRGAPPPKATEITAPPVEPALSQPVSPVPDKPGATLPSTSEPGKIFSRSPDQTNPEWLPSPIPSAVEMAAADEAIAAVRRAATDAAQEAASTHADTVTTSDDVADDTQSVDRRLPPPTAPDAAEAPGETDEPVSHAAVGGGTKADVTDDEDDVFATLPAPVAVLSPLASRNPALSEPPGDEHDENLLPVEPPAPEDDTTGTQPSDPPTASLGALASRLRTLSEPQKPQSEQTRPPETTEATPSAQANAPPPLTSDEAPFAPILAETNGKAAALADTSGVAFHAEERPSADPAPPTAPPLAEPHDLRDPTLEDNALGAAGHRNATNDPLHEPFSPHRTGVDEAEIVIRRDGLAEPLTAPMPDLKQR
ncbi:MAG: hypothetical protein AAFZ01_11540, partial [Pseudomonadota bacterium]